MLEHWGMQSIPSLPSLSGPLQVLQFYYSINVYTLKEKDRVEWFILCIKLDKSSCVMENPIVSQEISREIKTKYSLFNFVDNWISWTDLLIGYSPLGHKSIYYFIIKKIKLPNNKLRIGYRIVTMFLHCSILSCIKTLPDQMCGLSPLII